MSPLLANQRAFDAATSVLFFGRWICLPLIQSQWSLYTLVSTVPMYVVGGYYLAFFFSISHNFKGVYMLEDTSRSSNERDGSFLYKQVSFKLVLTS